MLQRSRGGSDPIRDLAQAPGEWTRPTFASGGNWKYLFRAVDKHGSVDCLQAVRPPKCQRRLSLPAQSSEGGERLSSLIHHDRQIGFLSEGHPAPAERRVVAERCGTPHLEISEQHP